MKKKKWFWKSCCVYIYLTYLLPACLAPISIYLSLLWKASLIYTGRCRRVLRFFFYFVPVGPLLAFYGAKGPPQVPFRGKRRMFVKKKINLDFLWIHKHSDTTHNPRGAGSYWERGKKSVFCTEDIKIYMRAAHSQLSPSYYYFPLPLKGPIITRIHRCPLYHPLRGTRAHTFTYYPHTLTRKP